MPESSIIITSKDNYSTGVRAMAAVTKSFSKDTDDMQTKLDKLNKTKATLKVEADKAKQELKEAQKAFADTGDEISRLQVVSKATTLENIQQNLKLVTKGANEVQKSMQQTEDVFRKSGNSGFSSKANAVVTALASSGAGAMLSSFAQNAANTWASSALGTENAAIASDAISSAISGASIGAMFGPLTAAIGAAVGAGVGVLNGAIENFKSQDDAFKSYVQDAYQNITEAQANSISNGSGIAAGRETDLISFSTLFGSKDTAQNYLSSLVDMANRTPFQYDDLTAMSKALATYGYSANGILPVLQTIGDAGAALGMTTSDMTTVATALGRMKSSDKATLEYLNMLNDRGISAVGILSKAYDVDQGSMYEMISAGEISGKKASEIILKAMSKSFSGSMQEQSQTFSGLTSTLEGLQDESDAAYGVGYNAEKKKGIQNEIDYLGGENGTAIQEANKAIGAWQASLENSKDKYIRDARTAAMESDEYQKAKAAGDAVEQGRILKAAEVKGMNEYNASEGAQLQLESEKSLIQVIRDDASLNQDYWDAGYEKGLTFSKGLMAAKSENVQRALAPGKTNIVNGQAYTEDTLSIPSTSPASPYYFGHAYGLRRVPYDGYPALLHQDERILTASEARSSGKPANVQVTITGNQFNVRSDADIDAIAEALVEKVERAAMLEQPA